MNLTMRADERIIERARERARVSRTSSSRVVRRRRPRDRLLALIELGDAGSVTILEPALNEPISHTFELAAALRKQPIPGVLEALEALDAKGLRSAKALRARMAAD